MRWAVPWTTILAVVLNSIGTVILLGGSLASARRRRDPRPMLVAAGVIVIALTASATRLDSYGLFAAGQATGIVLIMLGLVLRRQRARFARRTTRAGGLRFLRGCGVAVDRAVRGRRGRAGAWSLRCAVAIALVVA